jgi:hypothetical protein
LPSRGSKSESEIAANDAKGAKEEFGMIAAKALRRKGKKK